MHNRVSSFVCICAVFSCHLSCLRRRLKKPGARFHTLKTNEARFKRCASTSQGACGQVKARAEARARDRAPQTARPGYTISYHTMPCHTIPYHAMPYHTIPYHTIPYHTMPCHAMPCHAMPCHAMPCHTMPCHAMPCHAMPCHAMPCHAMPCHAMPCHAMPCHAIPYHTIPYYTIPCHAIPCHDVYLVHNLNTINAFRSRFDYGQHVLVNNFHSHAECPPLFKCFLFL